MRNPGKNTVPFALSASLALAMFVLPLQSAMASGTLADAARAGDIESSRELLRSGADVNLPEADGTTALLWAVYNSSPELVEILLKAGANPNQANSLDLTPLLQASRNGDAGIITALLAKDASLTNHSVKSEPALLAAARAGNVEAVKVLITAGADVNVTEPLDNQTALMWAVAAGHLDVAKLLIESGADVNKQARVTKLTKRKNADFPSGGFSALHWATRNGDMPMIELLAKSGANLNLTNGDNSTPMMLSIVNDRFDIAAQLLELGADANDGSLYFVTEMRDGTHDWRAQDGTVYRADHSNQLSALDLTRLLLEAGADPNKPFIGQMHNTSMCCDVKANSTPFFRSAIAADVEGIKLMLAHGADTAWSPALEVKEENDLAGIPRGNVGKTALMMAINGGKGVGVSGGPNDLRYNLPEFREPGNRATLDAVNVLLDAGADPNVKDANQDTALHIAAKALHPGIVKALVAHGADLGARNKDGLTAQEVVAKMDPPKATPGFFFVEPLAQPTEMAALLTELAAK